MATLSVLSYNSSPGLVKLKVNSGNASDGGLSIGGINNGNDGSGANSLNKTFSKITVHSVLSESNGNSLNISNNSGCGSGSNNHVNAIVRKIKDFGMSGTLNGVSGSKSTSIRAGALTVTARKRPLPESKAQQENKPLPGTVKKPRPAKDVTSTPKPPKKASDTVQRLKLQAQSGLPGSPGVVVTKPPGTPGRKGLPLPLAVARRNARERNRVKQVNNGFAALRERIPEEVAECFEAQGSGRGSVKKLSKVETLRMAVEYIRSLERLLGFNFPIGVARSLASAGADDSFSLIKDEFDALSPSMDEQFDDSLSNYDMDEYMAPSSVEEAQAQQSFLEQQAQQAMQMDLLPNITTLNGLQYIRIPGTNTYQLLTPDIFAGNSNSPPNSSMEDEQYSALMDTNCLSPATSTATTADLHSSPPSIIAATTATATAAAPATLRSASGACVNAATAALSRSPVPPATAASPRANSSLHHQQQQQHQQDSAQPAMLSPAVNELLLQSCAVDRLSDDRQFVAPTPLQPHLQPRMIKQEYMHEADFVSTAAPSRTTATPTLIYQPAAHDDQQQQQQQQMMLGHATLANMSPPLDACNSTALPANAMPTAGLQIYYEHDHDQNASFYEGVVTFKKEHGDVLLDTSTNAAALSDESMIDAMDWWEAHTPKSDGGSVIL